MENSPSDVADDDTKAQYAASVSSMNQHNRVLTPPIGRPCSRAEEEVKQFAGWLSMLEKMTGYLRSVTTLWASLVILAGFGNALPIRDFWFSTIVLLLNKMHILNRKYVDDEDHQDYYSSTSRTAHCRPRGCLSYVKTKGRDHYDAINPRLFPLRRILIMLIIIIKFAAAVFLGTITFSVPVRALVAAGEERNTFTARNKKYSLVILYILVSFEGFFFLAGDIYYLYKVYCRKQLPRLSEKLGFGSLDIGPVRGFLIDSISFPDSGRDMVTYAVDLLASDSRDKQLVGVRIIEIFSTKLLSEVLRNIGANLAALNTLVRMLKWDLPQGRGLAAMVLSDLAKEKENALAIARILGPIKAIAYLFESSESTRGSNNNVDAAFTDLGLRIIEELALDQDECEKIGKAKGLLNKFVCLTKVAESIDGNEITRDQEKTADQEGSLRLIRKENRASAKGGNMQLKKENDTALESSLRPKKSNNEASTPQERSLEVLKLVTAQRDVTWKNLRREISETSLVKNICDILSSTALRNDNPKLQKLGIEVLNNLAEEKQAKEHVGATKGVLEALVNIFFSPTYQEDLRFHAGKALEQLSLRSKSNCLRILRLTINKRLMVALMDESLRVRLGAARVLLYLCTYSGANFHLQALLHFTSGLVLKGIVDKDVEVQDVMVGIAAFNFKFITKLNNWINLCELAGISRAVLASELKRILMRHKYDVSTENPNTCSSVVELVVWMINIDPRNVNAFNELGIKEELKDILETTPEIEEAIALLV